MPVGSAAEGRRRSMKAIVQDRYGSTDVLEFRDIGRPEIADDEVLVRVYVEPDEPDVAASSLDRSSIHERRPHDYRRSNHNNESSHEGIHI
jgi:hypothetical protein